MAGRVLAVATMNSTSSSLIRRGRTAQRMYDQQELTVEQIARALGVSRSSIYRALNRTGSITHRREQQP